MSKVEQVLANLKPEDQLLVTGQDLMDYNRMMSEQIRTALKEEIEADLKKQMDEQFARSQQGAMPSAVRAMITGETRASAATILGNVAYNPYRAAVRGGEDGDMRGLIYSRAARLIGMGHGNRDAAIRQAEAWFKKNNTEIDELTIRVLNEATLEDGGIFVRPEISNEIIEILQAKTVVREFGANIIPSSTGAGEWPKETSDMTAQYTSEGQNAAVTGMEWGMIQPVVKDLAAIVPLSNQLLSDAGFAIDVYLRNKMQRRFQAREDIAFIRGLGTSNTPRGLRYWSSQVFNANATVNLANVTADLVKAVRLLEEANLDVQMDTVGWIMAPRTKAYLMSIRDGNGNLVFAPEMNTGKLYGFPFKVTTSIPTNLGSGGDESEIYLADFSHTYILEREGIGIETYVGGAYYDGTTVQSGISKNQTVIVGRARHDFFVTYSDAVVVIAAVKWI